MSIFGRTSLIIIAIATPALTLGNAGLYYRPSHYPPHNPHRQSNPPERSNVLGGAQLHVFDYKRPLVDTPTHAPPAYAQPVYDKPTVHAPPVYDSPAVHAPHMYDPPAIYVPPVYAPPVAYTQPPYNSPTTTTTPPTMHTLPVTTDHPYNPPAAYTSAYNSPAASSTSTRPSHTPDTYTPAPTHEDTPELPEATHEDAHKGVPEDTPEQAHKGTPEDAPEDTPQEGHKGTPEDAHEDAAPEDTSEDAHKGAPEDTSEDAHNDTPEVTPEDAHKDVPEDSHKDVPESTPDTYEKPTPPSRGHGKPSPLPNSVDRRNAPRVSRTKISRNAKRALPRQGHTRRFPFMRKRQQPGQHTVAPVTVNMIPGAGHATSTSSATTANALPASPSPLAPGIRIDTSQDALSFSSNPESTMPSVEAPTPPGSFHSEDSHDANLDAGGPALRTNKFTAIASVLSIVIGLIVFITIVKLTSNAMRKRKHPVGLGKYEDHLSSKGLIPEMSDKGHFESHDVIITRPDGSEISPLSSSRSSSPSLRPFDPRVVNPSPSPHPMPTFAPPPVPTSPLMPYVKLLSPTANLAQQNIMQDRVSEASEIMSVSTTTTDTSERPSASDGEVMGRQLSHRRMRSAPGSVVWSARSSAATGKFTSGVSGSEGYWESIDVCGSESAGRVACRSSRGRSVAMSVMW
ncbi:hypothetical protein EDB89DRAFT_2197385 [Lactarius sanguifluus]|nr:hypothetical protein EDB89DRAFT_2197385 [Lactarius sanguifluus]